MSAQHSPEGSRLSKVSNVSWAVVAHSTWEIEVGRSLSSRSVLSTEQVPGYKEKPYLEKTKISEQIWRNCHG